MKYVIELSEKDFDNIKHAYTAIFGDIYHIMQGAIANGKALEHPPVLDKIRAEIERIGGDDEKAFCKNLNESYKQGLKDALKVINKYKAESEVQDADSN